MNNDNTVKSHVVHIEEKTDIMEGGRIKFCICFIGIFVSYFLFGILQEKM